MIREKKNPKDSQKQAQQQPYTGYVQSSSRQLEHDYSKPKNRKASRKQAHQQTLGKWGRMERTLHCGVFEERQLVGMLELFACRSNFQSQNKHVPEACTRI